MAVEIYSKDSCMFCQKAKSFFNQHEIAFEEHDVSTADRFSQMMERIPTARTVPQIIIDGHVIGGWDVLDAHKEPILKKLQQTHS